MNDEYYAVATRHGDEPAKLLGTQVIREPGKKDKVKLQANKFSTYAILSSGTPLIENGEAPSQDFVIPAPIMELNETGQNVSISTFGDGRVDEETLKAFINEIGQDETKDTLQVSLIAPYRISPKLSKDIISVFKKTKGIERLIIRTSLRTLDELPVTMELNKDKVTNTAVDLKTGGTFIST